jgi:transcriptional regulator with XRE-family HTH domain
MPTEKSPPSIGARIRRIREERKISSRTMARIAGVHHNTYLRWETNEHDTHLGIRKMLLIAHYLEIDFVPLIPSTYVHPPNVTTWSANGAQHPHRRSSKEAV